MQAWWLYVGSGPQAATAYVNSGSLGARTEYQATGLPTDGRELYVTLWYQPAGSGAWNQITQTYTAADEVGGPPGPAVPLAPSGNGAGASPDFSWEAVDGATWYRLWVDDGSRTVLTRWYRAGQAGCDAAAVCTVSPTLSIGGTGRWWVRTWSPDGYGPWSSARSFTP